MRAVNKLIIECRLHNEMNISEGDIVTSLNGNNIVDLSITEINHILTSTVLQFIESINAAEWRRYCRNKHHNFATNQLHSNQSTALILNGLNIIKSRIKAPFTVSCIDRDVLLTRVQNELNKGDIITKINNIDINLLWSNKTAAEYLSKEIVQTIVSH